MTASAPQPDDGAELPVGPGVVVWLTFRVFDEEAELVEESAEPSRFLFGYGELLPKLEQAIGGLPPGSQRTVVLKPEDGYGRRDPKALLEVDRDEFPDDVRAGDHFEAQDEAGRLLVLRVLEVLEDRVVIDQNHPLAGQKLRIELTVTRTGLAEQAELDRAAARLTEEPAPALIGVERLLKGPGRRYDQDPKPEG